MVKISSKINKDLLRINKNAAKTSKSSIFEIVINPNKSYVNDFEGKMKVIESAFHKACEYIFASRNVMKLIKCICPGCKSGKDPCSREDIAKKITEINCVASVEVGSRRGFLHCNATLNVIHNTKIQVNLVRLRQVSNLLMSRVMNNPRVYVGVKCLTSNLHNSMNYVSHAKEYKQI